MSDDPPRLAGTEHARAGTPAVASAALAVPSPAMDIMDRGEPGLTATQQATLWGLVRWPFISARDLCLGLLDAAQSAVYRALAQLAGRSLVEWLPYVSSRVRHERLWYLAEAGVRLAARLAGAEPASFAQAWGLHEAALVHRLGRLEHLTLSRGFLLDLQAALRAGYPAYPVMTAWQPWPVRLASTSQRQRACLLDGAGTLSWAMEGGDQRDAGLVLVWDDGGGLALEVLRPRLLALVRARRAHDRAVVFGRADGLAGPAPRTFPAVLLIAARPERARAAWSQAHEVARMERVHPLALLLTSAPALHRAGPVDGLWRDPTGREGTLVALLAPRAMPRQRGGTPASDMRNPASIPVSGTWTAPAVGRGALVQGQFARRSAAVLSGLAGVAWSRRGHGPAYVAPVSPETAGESASGGAMREAHRRLTRTELVLTVVALQPSDLRLLRCLALVPLATQATLAALTGDRLVSTHAATQRGDPPPRLARLLRWGLCDYLVPGRILLHTDRRYFLTPRGLLLLATLAGLPPAAYCRATGAIAGTGRTLAPPGRQRGRPHPGQAASAGVAVRGVGTLEACAPGRRGRVTHSVGVGGNRLAYYARYLEHTAAVQEVLVAFVGANRTHLTRDCALEAWQFEWAALRRYPHDGRWRAIRPDAYGRYRLGGGVLAFFLEIDRGTSGLHNLAAKLAAYCAYRDSGLHQGDPVHGGLAFPVLLVVTTGEERLRHIVTLAHTVAADHLTRPLAVRGTTAYDLAAHGPFGPIWRDTVQQPPRPLF